jgi:subfamily B ATP-binding cassette protein MsbA
MKRFGPILFYLKDQKGKLLLYLLFSLLTVLFSLISLSMLAPFLQLLFGKEQPVLQKPEWALSSKSIMDHLKYFLSYIIVRYDEVKALGAICGIVILSVLFKNFFLYLTFRVMVPLRNNVMARLRVFHRTTERRYHVAHVKRHERN